MKLCVQRPPEHKREYVEGAAARAVLRQVLQEIGSECLIPEMPYTGKIRCRAKDRLKEGGTIWTERNEIGNPTRDSVMLSMPLKIVGIIKEDGTYEAVGEAGKEGVGGESGASPTTPDNTPMDGGTNVQANSQG